jgi:hypothetical protein
MSPHIPDRDEGHQDRRPDYEDDTRFKRREGKMGKAVGKERDIGVRQESR